MIKNYILIVFLILILLTAAGCKKSVEVSGFDVVGFDENNISTVTIGTQVWMAENLKVTIDPDGNQLNSISVNGDSSNDEIYGRVYTFDQALAACPPGWHLPTIEEWHVLFDTLGGVEVAGGKMKTIEYWDPPNVGATNSSGFSAVPAGPNDGFGWACHFWSATGNGNNTYIPSLMNTRQDVYILYDQPKSIRISVRYIRD